MTAARGERLDDVDVVPLSALIDRLASGRMDRGRDFARELARQLHEQRGHLSLPLVDRLGLTDVVVTLDLGRVVRLVLTGWIDEGRGELTLRYEERDFVAIDVRLHRARQGVAYTWCTLDRSEAGAQLVVESDDAPLPRGTVVTLVVRSTIGEVEQVRARAGGRVVTMETADLRPFSAL